MRKLRFAVLVGGFGLLGWLVVRSGPARLGADLLKVGWWMMALLALSREVFSIRSRSKAAPAQPLPYVHVPCSRAGFSCW